jgi:hypothetical protein
LRIDRMAKKDVLRVTGTCPGGGHAEPRVQFQSAMGQPDRLGALSEKEASKGQSTSALGRCCRKSPKLLCG